MVEAGSERDSPGVTTGCRAGDDTFTPHYLAAKKGVDDRALNRHAWDTLVRSLPETTVGEAARVLEIGAGIGTMVERAVEWGLLEGAGLYLATDQEAGHLQAARHRLRDWATARGASWCWESEERGRLRGAGGELTLVLKRASAEELAERPPPSPPFHLLIAHALLDLVDFTALLPQLFPLLTPRGVLYLTCNFDGETIFLPGYPWDEEREIIRRYHASMEQRLPGSSHCGRRLLAFLQGQGLEILAAGASDWVVHPRGGGYAGEEGPFLHAMVDTVERELSKKAPPPGLSAWAETRRRQIEAGGLTFMARHLDILARLGGP